MNILPKGIWGNFARRFSFWDNQVNNSWFSIDTHFKGLVVTEILNVQGDLPNNPANGETYILDSDYSVWTWFDETNSWFSENLESFEIFYDLDNGAFYYFDGANIQPLIVNADIIPAGIRMLFYEATAPTGWTLDVTVNDRFVRVSNTAGGSVSGTWNNLSHTHNLNNHTHSVSNHTHTSGSLKFQVGRARSQTTSGNVEVQFYDTSGSFLDILVARDNPSATGVGALYNGVPVSLSTSYTNLFTGGSSSGSTGSAGSGNTGTPSNNNTGTPSGLTHGSTQHAYADFIICSRN